MERVSADLRICMVRRGPIVLVARLGLPVIFRLLMFKVFYTKEVMRYAIAKAKYCLKYLLFVIRHTLINI